MKGATRVTANVSLMTRIQLLQRRTRTTTEHEQALGELENDVRDLIELSDQLLDLGHARASAELGDTPTDIAAAIASMDLDTHSVASDLEQSELRVTMPASQIRQIVTNLVSNAHRHGAPPIELQLHRVGTNMVLSIHDAGPGIDPEFLPHVLERFSRGPEARNLPGAGLGLALVDAITRRYSGELRICSNGVHHDVTPTFDCTHPALGTTVSIAVPLAITP